MPHALLLSPDDQAVNAITGVLDEMSVTCERPLDGVSAAHKLNSQSFDLVLVDCENLPAAKLIFDVCRRGKNGNNPVPIAIVDGRAGLPTAFRLGAELILTKPVAKDQARSTIRTAVGRVRKDTPQGNVPEQPASAVLPSTIMSDQHEQAAAAATASPQLTNFADPAPICVPSAVTTTLSGPARSMKMQSAVAEATTAPVTPGSGPKTASFSPSSVAEFSLDRSASVRSKSASPLKPSDDPVLAELESAELAESQLESSRLEKAEPVPVAAQSAAPVFSSYQHGQQKTRGPLVALLVLALAGVGFYAAWMYQPGFRALAQPQIDRVLALAGMAPPPASAPSPAKPSARLAPAANSAPAPDPHQTQSAVPEPATSSAITPATGSPATSATVAAPVQTTTTPGTAVAASNSLAATAVPSGVAKTEAGKPGDSKKDTAAATSSNTPLPGENSAIILSSKGAEKRLAHSIPAKYPVDARSGEAQGTVVLKEVVDETGKVQGVRLVDGDAALATAAIDAVKQWRYRPYVRDGKAQPFQTVVIVDFQKP